MDKLREKDEEKLIHNYHKSEGKSDFRWVKPILENPGRYGDNRRRIIMWGLVPFLINVKGESEKDTERIIIDWIEKTPRGDDNNFKGLIRSEIRSYKRSGYLPSKKSVEGLI